MSKKEKLPYSTLAELKTAIDSGALKLDADCGNCLTIDNDSTYIYLAEFDENGDEIQGKTKKVFDLHPADLMEQALTLLGIPWQNA